MATVGMPMRLAVRVTRQEISPRLAIKILLNRGRLEGSPGEEEKRRPREKRSIPGRL